MCNTREEKLDAGNGAAYHVIIDGDTCRQTVRFKKDKASKKEETT